MEKIENRSDWEEVIEEFENLTRDAKRVQKETLKKMLEDNCEAEYLKKWGLEGRTDPEAYISCVPLVTHKDLEPFIQKIADDATHPILTAGEPMTRITLTSGTTQGKRKLILFNDGFLEVIQQVWRISFAFRNREFPIGNGKALSFIYGSAQLKTKGGLVAGSATNNLYRSEQYKETMKAMHTTSCSPHEVIFSSDFDQSSYCHLLCGLIFRDEIQVIMSTFAQPIVHSFRSVELFWEELCSDIKTGTLSTRITLPTIRTAMAKILKPNPDLADQIHKKCLSLSSSNRDWYGMIEELFPNTKYIHAIMTGAMQAYLKKLRHYAGGIPLVSGDYGASEGFIGANVNPSRPPEMVTYVVLPNIGYFGFIPIQDESEPLTTVGLTDVEVGKEYEVVLTNCLGLYRYRLGDIVKVVGFHNSSPELQFVSRKDIFPPINTDKTSENDLQLAIESTTKLLAAEKLEIVDFTCQIDLSSLPGHYVIFWEMSGEASEEAMQECCNRMDLGFIGDGYVSSRKSHAIGALELRVLKGGTFGKIMDHYVGMGSTLSQYKTPRCVAPSNQKVLKILCDNVVNSYFSTAFG